MANRVKIDTSSAPKEMPTLDEIADTLQAYVAKDGEHRMTWRQLADACGVNDRILRKMHSRGNFWYRNAEAFWSWHVQQS